MSTQQIIEIVLNVANAICLIFCFTKMGIDPWAAIIPIYGPWKLYERVWGAGWISLLTLTKIWSEFPHFNKRKIVSGGMNYQPAQMCGYSL